MKNKEGSLISLYQVTKKYATPSGTFTAINEVSLEVQRGEFVAVVGKSGSGKSTLINVITGIDSPSSGEVFVASTAIHSLNQEQLAIWRGKNVASSFNFSSCSPR